MSGSDAGGTIFGFIGIITALLGVIALIMWGIVTLFSSQMWILAIAICLLAASAICWTLVWYADKQYYKRQAELKKQ